MTPWKEHSSFIILIFLVNYTKRKILTLSHINFPCSIHPNATSTNLTRNSCHRKLKNWRIIPKWYSQESSINPNDYSMVNT